MTWLLNLIPGGAATVFVGGIVAVVGILWRMMAGAKKSGVLEQKAKEAVAREKDLNRIKTAAAAGARVRPDDPSLLDDPYNRDRRGKP